MFDRLSARPPECMDTVHTPWNDPGIIENPGIGYERASAHLRAIRKAKYGEKSSEAKPPSGVPGDVNESDMVEFYCGAVLNDATCGAFRGGGAVAYSRSDPSVSMAYAVQQLAPVNELPVVVVCTGAVSNMEDMCQLYGLDPTVEYTTAEFIRELYCRDFADSDGDASDQPATCLNCLEGDWCFVLFDAASQYLLAAQSATPLKPIHWGCAADDGSLLFSTEPAVLPRLCTSKDSAGPTEFPHSCYFENDGFQNPSYEHGNIFSFTRRLAMKRALQPLLKVDSSNHICGINFRTQSGANLCSMDVDTASRMVM